MQLGIPGLEDYNQQNMGARARTMVDGLLGGASQRAKQVSDRLGSAYGANNILASRASLLGGVTMALPSASEAMGEGRTLEAGATLAGAAGTGAIVDRLSRGVKNPLARLGIQAAGSVVAPVIGQGVGQIAENTKAGITGKDPAGKTSRAATRAQMLDDAEVMAEVQRRFGAAALEPYLAANKDLMQHSLNVQYQNDRRYEPLINRMKNADMVRQQALMNTQTSNYALLGTVATAGRLATGAQEQAGANLRTALTSNPYAGSVMQAPNISFG
jgi:hypothetical protein